MTLTTEQRIAMLRMLANVNPGTTIQWFYRETADELEQLEKSLQDRNQKFNELLEVAKDASMALNTPFTTQSGTEEFNRATGKLYNIVNRMFPAKPAP